ncbi:MAG: glycosyltransferase [bacterium]
MTVLVRHKTSDGVLHLPGEEYACDPALAARSEARGFVYPTDAPADLMLSWWTYPGRVLGELGEPAVTERTAGAVTVLQATTYDPGCSAYRLHNAINLSSPHASAFVRYGDDNPHCSWRQFDGHDAAPLVRAMVAQADVVHSHMDYAVLELAQTSWRGVLVHHYHGSEGTTRNPQTLVRNARDAELGAIQIGARLYHLRFSDRMRWLPIAIPVERYARIARVMRAELTPGHVFRVAHSPTLRRLKGTDVFLGVCERLRARGVRIEPVLIEGMRHENAIMAKAQCDATFDSFWLGIQGSGLEAAAMGQPVIAGDPEAASEYRAHTGDVPYTYANDAACLEGMLEWLATDPAFYAQEAQRVGAYVRQYHDYPAVARRYADILRERIPEIAVPEGDVPEDLRGPVITHTPPVPRHPEAEPVIAPARRKPKHPKRPPLEKR